LVLKTAVQGRTDNREKWSGKHIERSEDVVAKPCLFHLFSLGARARFSLQSFAGWLREPQPASAKGFSLQSFAGWLREPQPAS